MQSKRKDLIDDINKGEVTEETISYVLNLIDERTRNIIECREHLNKLDKESKLLARFAITVVVVGTLAATVITTLAVAGIL